MNIRNNFPGGLFKYVYQVSLHDEYPFKHEFFTQIARSFSVMKKLTINNNEPRNHTEHNESKYDNRNLPVVEYPHLTDLYLNHSHDDYAEQFLLDTRTC